MAGLEMEWVRRRSAAPIWCLGLCLAVVTALNGLAHRQALCVEARADQPTPGGAILSQRARSRPAGPGTTPTAARLQALDTRLDAVRMRVFLAGQRVIRGAPAGAASRNYSRLVGELASIEKAKTALARHLSGRPSILVGSPDDHALQRLQGRLGRLLLDLQGLSVPRELRPGERPPSVGPLPSQPAAPDENDGGIPPPR